MPKSCYTLKNTTSIPITLLWKFPLPPTPETEDIRNGKSTFKHNQRVFTNVHIIIYLILIYNFSEFKLHILSYFCLYLKPPCHLVIRRTSLQRLLVCARSMRPVALQRFQPCRRQALLNYLQELQPHPKPASIKNKIPVILSGIKEEHKNWCKLMGELRQFHPSLNISQIKELPKGDFLFIGDYARRSNSTERN